MTPQERRDAAVAIHGITCIPEAAGFVLSDGRWLDLGFGGPQRMEDHRVVGGLLLTGEAPSHVEPNCSTEAMLRWMDKAHATRVSLSYGPDGRYGFCQIPREAKATRAVLVDPSALLRLFRLASVVELHWRDQSWTCSPSQLGWHFKQILRQNAAVNKA